MSFLMRTWGSLAVREKPLQENGWEIYRIPINDREFEMPVTRLWQVKDKQTLTLSYVLCSHREAIVIDPQQETKIYEKIAKEHYSQITNIFETDQRVRQKSSGKKLAYETGAMYWSPVKVRQQLAEETDWPEAIFHFERLIMRALATPGPTPNSLTYVVANMALVGDLLRLEDLGRVEGKMVKQNQAQQLWQSAHHLFTSLPETTLVLPGQAAAGKFGPFLVEMGVLKERMHPWFENPAHPMEKLMVR
jgi:glyoxylase-like metal-dependent hydrolase (beta-lactamase superfamily II)